MNLTSEEGSFPGIRNFYLYMSRNNAHLPLSLSEKNLLDHQIRWYFEDGWFPSDFYWCEKYAWVVHLTWANDRLCVRYCTKSILDWWHSAPWEYTYPFPLWQRFGQIDKGVLASQNHINARRIEEMVERATNAFVDGWRLRHPQYLKLL